MPRNSYIRSKKFILLIVVILLIIVFGLFKWSGGVIVFSYWRPGYLPAGISIKEARVEATSNDVFTQLNFRTVDWVYGVQESRTTDTLLPPAQGNYNPLSSNFTCSLFDSPHGQRYRLCHSIDYGKISVYEVTQINGNTYINSRIPTSVGHIIDTHDLGKFVDSFKRTPRIFAPAYRHDGP